jgi:hypothetical protein
MDNKKDQPLHEIIIDLLDCEAIAFDVEHTYDFWFYPISFLRLTSTRELLSDEIKDRLIANWKSVVEILRRCFQGLSPEFSSVNGLCIRQSNYGYEPHSKTFRNKHHQRSTYMFDQLNDLQGVLKQ